MAQSFLVESLGADLGGLGASLRRARSGVAKASAGIVFAAGIRSGQLERLASAVRDAWPGIPAVVVPASGVLSERGEVEGGPAASGLLWAGGRAEAFAVEGGALGDTLGGADAPSTALLFPQPEAFAPEALDLAPPAGQVQLLGGGTAGGPAVAIGGDGALRSAPFVGLALRGLARPIVDASPACRLLGSFETIDEVERSGLVLRIGGRPALEALSKSAASLDSTARPQIFALVADGDDDRRFLVRPIRGVHPDKRGVVVGPDARVGRRMAFAVRDGAVARIDLERAARQVAQRASGSAPRFALFVSCAGRGRALFGAADAQTRILRQRFGDLPVAGMQSSFEIVPWSDGSARIQLYTGVLALFASPS